MDEQTRAKYEEEFAIDAAWEETIRSTTRKGIPLDERVNILASMLTPRVELSGARRWTIVYLHVAEDAELEVVQNRSNDPIASELASAIEDAEQLVGLDAYNRENMALYFMLAWYWRNNTMLEAVRKKDRTMSSLDNYAGALRSVLKRSVSGNSMYRLDAAIYYPDTITKFYDHDDVVEIFANNNNFRSYVFKNDPKAATTMTSRALMLDDSSHFLVVGTQDEAQESWPVIARYLINGRHDVAAQHIKLLKLMEYKSPENYAAVMLSLRER